MTGNTQTICVFTGTRAEFGLLSPVVRRIQDAPDMELQVLATGAHLSAAHGSTVDEIEAAGLPVSARVVLDLSDDSPLGIAQASGTCLAGCARELTRLAPDMLLLLGDRYEALAAAFAATICRIPVAHIHGGEVTRGAMDDAFRHAITKLSHLHFTSTEEYRQRVIRMGEDPAMVFNVGALGAEIARTMTPLSRQDLEADLKLDPGRPFLLVTFHPPTLEPGAAREQMAALLDALDQFPEYGVLLTKAGADTEGLGVNAQAEAYAQADPGRVRLFTSLGQKRYLSAMRWCGAVVGNSSSGIIEAPSLGAPSVNIGSRQEGRTRADSVIDCGPGTESIRQAITRALSPAFRQEIAGRTSPFERPDTTERIVQGLRAYPGGVKKIFHDLDVR